MSGETDPDRSARASEQASGASVALEEWRNPILAPVKWTLLAIYIIVLVLAVWIQTLAPQRDFFLQLNALASAWSPALWSFLTLLGEAGVLFAVLSPLLLWRPQWMFAVLAAVPLGGLLSVVLKAMFKAPRPATLINPDEFNFIGPLLNNASFPSGHTITAFAAATAIFICLLRARRFRGSLLLGIGGLCFALLVGLSRIAVGAHWPVDVLAGAACGGLAGFSGAWAAARFARLWQSAISQFVLGQALLLTALWLVLRSVEFPLGYLAVWLAVACVLGTVAGQLVAWRRALGRS